MAHPARGGPSPHPPSTTSPTPTPRHPRRADPGHRTPRQPHNPATATAAGRDRRHHATARRPSGNRAAAHHGSKPGDRDTGAPETAAARETMTGPPAPGGPFFNSAALPASRRTYFHFPQARRHPGEPIFISTARRHPAGLSSSRRYPAPLLH